LSRTVIEGGRRWSNCLERRASHGVERVRVREWLARTGGFDEAPRPIKFVYRGFYDKLAPAWRWLDRQVGRPWRLVYSELRAKFDSRTIAGAHVVNDHVLPSVWRGVGDPWRRASSSWIVDRVGILRPAPWKQPRFLALVKETHAWAASRRIAKTLVGYWWAERVMTGEACHWSTRCGLRHTYAGGTRWHGFEWRYVAKLTKADAKRFEKLPCELRDPLRIAPHIVTSR
jgi:hypothetical protein